MTGFQGQGGPGLGPAVSPAKVGESDALKLSLTAQDATTEWKRVPPGATNAVIDVQPDPAKTGTAWVAELQWTAEAYTDNERARSFDPVVEFNNTTPARTRTGLPSGGYIRLKTTTPDGNSDPAAPVVVVIT